MANYVCETQICGIQSFTGPSGNNYTSLQGVPFNVNNKDDQAFFDNNKRFRKVGGLVVKKTAKKTAAKKKNSEPIIDEFRAWLLGIKLSKEESDEVVEAFGSIDNLRAEVTGGTDLTQVIRKETADKIQKSIEEGMEA